MKIGGKNTEGIRLLLKGNKMSKRHWNKREKEVRQELKKEVLIELDKAFDESGDLIDIESFVKLKKEIEKL